MATPSDNAGKPDARSFISIEGKEGINAQRFVMTDHVWQRLAPHLPEKAGDAGSTSKDHRLFLEAVFWRGSDRRTTARLTACFRQLEQPVSAVSAMGHGGLIRGGGMNVL